MPASRALCACAEGVLKLRKLRKSRSAFYSAAVLRAAERDYAVAIAKDGRSIDATRTAAPGRQRSKKISVGGLRSFRIFR